MDFIGLSKKATEIKVWGCFMKDLISVVVPVFNVERYLEKCLDDICTQSYKELEIILVDDGSTDRSGEICDIFSLKDSRIKVIHKSNGGLSDARNAGIDVASGRYITFIDSDDFISHDTIEYLYILIQKYKAGIATCGVVYCDENGVEVSRSKGKKEELFQGNEQMRQFFINEGVTTTAWGKLYALNLFSNLRYPVGKYHEDIFTTYLLIDLADGMAVGTETKYWYRQVSGSIMNSNFSIRHLDAIIASKKRAEFISKKYPSLKKNALRDLVYCCIKCIERISISDYHNLSVENKIQQVLRKYELYYLFSKSSLSGKVFSLICTFNLNTGRKIYKYTKRNILK